MKNKVGIGIITCNREDFLQKLYNSVPSIGELIIVNDGKPFEKFKDNSAKISKVIQHQKHQTIGFSKNQALEYLMQQNCEHLFLLEDDIACKDDSVFENYIRASEKSGILHFNYAFHGPWNLNQDGSKNSRKVIKFDDVELAFYYNVPAAFVYFNQKVIKSVGYMDTRYPNIFEHVDHTFRIIKHGFHPPFRWFADLSNSDKFIEELDPYLKESINSKDKRPIKLRRRIFSLYFGMKNGKRIHKIKDASEEEFMSSIEKIRSKYGKSKTIL